LQVASRRCSSGAARALRSAPGARGGGELAPLLLDAALLGRQHLDLLLHLHLPRCSLARLAWRRAGVFRSGSCLACSSTWAGQQLGLLLGLGACPASVPARPRRPRGARPTARSAPAAGQALLHALAAFDHKADSASSRPTSALASYSLPWAWLTWSPAA
jgi:hypothetical protein